MSALRSVFASINQPQAPVPVGENENAWLISPAFDLMFVCGLAPWVFGLLAYFVVGTAADPKVGIAQHQFAIPFVIASLLIGEGHQFTSIVRYYFGGKGRTKQYYFQRLPFWFLYLGIGLLILSTSGINISSHPVTGLLVPFASAAVGFGAVLFPCVLLQHVCAQAKAIGMIYCGMAKYKLTIAQNILLWFATWSLVLAGTFTIAGPIGFSIAQFESSNDGLFAMLVAIRETLVMFALFWTGLFAYITLRRGIKAGEWMPMGTGVMWTNLVIWVLCPLQEMVYAWIFVPLLFHATQHWSLAWHTTYKEALARNNCPILSRSESFKEFGKLVVPVTCLSLLVLFLPQFAFPEIGTNGTLGLEWSMLVFYFHYFADRIVWRPQR